MKPKNSIIESYKLFLTNIVNFKGRTRRSDFWQVYIVNSIILIIIYLFFSLILKIGGAQTLEIGDAQHNGGLIFGATGVSMVFSIIYMIAMSSLIVRRLHDTGKPGWIAIIIIVSSLFIGIIGLVLMLVFLTKDSQPGANVYGENPKYIDERQFADSYTEQEPIAKICPVCNYEVVDGSLFCPQCGTALGGQPNNE